MPTDRSHAEGNGRSVAEQLALLMRHANDAILVADERMRIVEANDRALALYGYTSDEVKRLTVLDLRTAGAAGAATQQFARALDSAGTAFETTHRRKDGSEIAVEVSARPLEIGGRPHLLGIVRDITERRRVERAIRDAEAAQRALIDAVPDAVFLMTPDGTITVANQGLARRFGKTVAELIGTNTASLTNEAVAAQRRAFARTVMESGQPLTVEDERDGLLLESQLYPVRDAGGTITHIAVFGRDVTASRRIARNMRDSELKYRALFETADDAILLLDESRFVDCNPAALRMFGCAREQLIGAHPMEFSPATQPNGRSSAEEAEKRIALAFSVGPQSFEWTHCRLDGTLFFAEVTLNRLDLAGAPHLQAIVRDVTERKRAAVALGESLERLRLQAAALEATVNAVMITDPAGAIVWVNPAFSRITGYTPGEVIGQNPRILKSGRQSKEVYDDLWRTISSGRSWSGELANLRKDGSLYNEEITITPVRDQLGAVAHYVAVIHDVTQRKSLEKQVYETQRLEGIGLLASGIAHDLNNILAPIAMAIELLRKDYPGENHMLDIVEQSTQRGADIVRQVLTFARGTDSNRAPFHIGRLVKEISKLISETLPRNITFTQHLTAREDVVLVDPTQIHQVLLNLAVNARDAMPDGGRLDISLTNERFPEDLAALPGGARSGDFVSIVVSDTGAGMPPDIVARIFEPFFTTKPRGQGTGLGLSTVHGIVRGHGGCIEVQSTPGAGTTFKVRLPTVAQPEALADEASETGHLAGRGRCILVADDEAAIRRIAQKVLEGRGFTTLLAEDGHQAVELFREHRAEITLVVLDRMMPGQSGEAAAVAIHTLAPTIPIILSTGLFSDDDAGAQAAQLESAGVVATLQKPFTAPQLLSLIAAHI